MRLWKAHAITAATFALILVATALPSWGAVGCNLGCAPCPASGAGACTGNGCGGPVAVWQSGGAPCAGSGSFDLTATQYLNTSGGAGAPIDPPPLRFWSFNGYLQDGNSGCPTGTTDPTGFWIGNGDLDYGQPAVPAHGHWAMFQSNWNFPGVDSCFSAATGRTVAEISFADGQGATPKPAEGTVNHFSWYVLASTIPDAGGSFEFNAITGANNCGTSVGNDIPAAKVGGVTIATKGSACTGGAAPTQFSTSNTADATFFDFQVTLTDATPHWYSEGGRDGAPALIAGYQILYQASPEPTSSKFCNGWLPTRSTAAPATMAAAVVPLSAAANPVTITLPKGAAGTNYWIATRLVYVDAASPLGAFDPATATNGPRIVSTVSSHCGPVQFSGTIMAVHFNGVSAQRTSEGVKISWTTALEDDVYGFSVIRSTSADGLESYTDVADLKAEGVGFGYEKVDLTADPHQTYYYYVQELATGSADRSEIVKVEPQAAPQTHGAAAGGRSRVRQGR